MSRLPTPGSDEGNWGTILNDFLGVAHNSDGTLKDAATIAGAQQKSALTTKGDLYAATGSGATARLAAGSNGQVLTANSATSTGLTWTTPTTAVDTNAAAVGLVAQTFPVPLATDHFVLNSGVFVVCTVYIPTASSVSTLGVGVRAAASGSTGVNAMAIYQRVSASSATLVGQTGDMTSGLTGSAPAWVSGAISGGAQLLSPGIYYVGLLTHFSSGPNIATTTDSTNSIGGPGIPAINNVRPTIFATSQTSLPASFDPSSYNLNSVMYYLTLS